MENRIYYGEYSLRHWIDLILRKEIVLPEYQRSFVWNDVAVKRFIKSLKEKQFVPPVTIAHYKVQDEKNETNLILDGQQRLTSLILAEIGLCPDRTKFETLESITKSEDDSESDEPNSNSNVSIKWTFNELLKFGDDIQTIKENVKEDSRYIELTGIIKINNTFLENTFLGFSYIVPESEDKDEVQKMFSKTFREINYFGKSLSAQESRRSLYFMNDEYRDYFDGKCDGDDVLSNFTITEKMQTNKIDFIRYLSILSQYIAKKESSDDVLKNYSSYASRESYYVDYVSFILGLDQEDFPTKFDGFVINDVFPDGSWKTRYKTLQESTIALKEKIPLGKSKVKGNFDSWIDVDYYLFGLIYFVLFEGKSISLEESLIKQIQSQINEKRKDKESSYVKGPNRVGNLRNRLIGSINIYSKYTK